MTPNTLALDILTALMDDDEPFLLIHYGLVNERGYRDLSVAELMSSLEALEDAGFVIGGYVERGRFVPSIPDDLREWAISEYVARLPAASGSEAGLDDVGLWFSITPAGRHLREKLTKAKI